MREKNCIETAVENDMVSINVAVEEIYTTKKMMQRSLG